MIDWQTFLAGVACGAGAVGFVFVFCFNLWAPPAWPSRQVGDCERWSGFAKAKRDEERVQ